MFSNITEEQFKRWMSELHREVFIPGLNEHIDNEVYAKVKRVVYEEMRGEIYSEVRAQVAKAVRDGIQVSLKVSSVDPLGVDEVF